MAPPAYYSSLSARDPILSPRQSSGGTTSSSGSNSCTGLTGGAVAGIVIGVVVAVLLLFWAFTLQRNAGGNGIVAPVDAKSRSKTVYRSSGGDNDMHPPRVSRHRRRSRRSRSYSDTEGGGHTKRVRRPDRVYYTEK